MRRVKIRVPLHSEERFHMVPLRAKTVAERMSGNDAAEALETGRTAGPFKGACDELVNAHERPRLGP